MRNQSDRVVDIVVILIIITVVILKITNVITISWLWLLSPIWVGLIIGFGLCVLITVMFLLRNLYEYIRRKR